MNNVHKKEFEEAIANVKIGDTVASMWYSFGFGDTYTLHKVTKVTKSGQLEVDDNSERKYRPRYDDWRDSNGIKLIPVTQEIYDNIEKKSIVSKLENTKFEKISLNKLRQLAATLGNEE